MTMAKTKKSSAKPTAQADMKVAPEPEIRMFEAQPHQVVAINRTEKGILILDKSRQRAYTDMPSLVLRPNIPTLVPRYLLPEIRPYVKSGEIEIPHDQRGVPSPYIDASFSTDAAFARDGVRPGPNRQERIAGWRDTLVDGSLSEVVVDVLTAMGLPDDIRNEETAAVVRDLVRVFDRSYLEPKDSPDRAFYQPWIRRSQELIAIHRAKQAGLTEEVG
jgi:hypothetical protein